MRMNNKTNEVWLGGYVSHADIRNGQYGPYGPATIAIDDGYRDPKSGQWVDRVQFIRVELSGKKPLQSRRGTFLRFQGSSSLNHGNRAESPVLGSRLR